MEQYKVLLVDDEEDARQSIVNKLDWPALGFEVVGQAGNGQEALELCEQLAPDVIMTDIQMPFMDGLELCRRAKQLLPGVRVAIFSGFDEFEYAKEAITLEVEEYILKPIDARELTDVFKRIRTSLDAEVAQRRDVERLRRHYEESQPLLRQQWLATLLEGRMSAESLREHADEYGFDAEVGGYCVAVVQSEKAGGTALFGETRLVNLSLQQLVAETLQNTAHSHVVNMPESIVLLFELEQGTSSRWVAARLGQLFPAARKLLGIGLSIGVGGVYPKAEEVCLSYREACSALEYQILVEPGQCIYLGDIEPGATDGTLPDEKYAEEVVRQIKIGSREELETAVAAMVQYFKATQIGIQQYQIYLLELSTQLVRLIRSYQLDAAEAGLEELLAEKQLMRFSSLDEMGRWLQLFCANLRTLIRRERKDSSRLLAERARDYMLANYPDSELSLDLLCSYLNVSPAYFSTIFKRETGQGFIGYLTALRLEKALEYLATTDEKTYQIAEKVGYADPNYFGYVFKKHYGVSPSKYRLNGAVSGETKELEAT